MNTETFASRLSTLPSSRREGLAAIFRKAQQRVLPAASDWENPEQSVGRYIGKPKWHHIWEAKGPAQDVFYTVSPRIKAYLEDAVEPISSRVTWSMYMVGKARSLASPFIIFCCEVYEYRRDVRNIIKESSILNGYPGIKTDHLPRPPGFPQLVPVGAAGQPMYNRGAMMALTSKARSACGSQIFIDANGITSVSSTPLSTIGGVIRLGEKLYYTTAAHALSPVPDSVDGDEVLSANDDYGSDEDALSLDCNKRICGTSASNPGEEDTTPRHPVGRTNDRSDDNRYLKDEILRQWDLQSHHEAEEPLSSLTKPGKLSPSPTGRIFMTSINADTREAGLDYALIEMSSRHHVVENVIKVGPSNKSIVKVRSVVRSQPRDVDIVAVTPRGTTDGWISGTPVYSSTPGQRTYVRMFKAVLDGPIHRGDCGTWVVDATTGDLFGHIVLGSPGGGAALIIPFSDIFDDIMYRVGESPTFPTARDDALAPDDALVRFIRKTISSAREVPELPSGSDDDGHRRTTVSPIESESEIEEFSDPLRIKRQLEEFTKYLLSETGDGMKRLNISGRGSTTNTKAHPVHQERTSQVDLGASYWVDDISRESARLMAQKNLKSYRQHDQSRGRSGFREEGNSSFPRDRAVTTSSASLALGDHPPGSIPPHNEPLDPPEPRTDPKFQHVLSTFSNAPMRWENIELLDSALKEIDLSTIYSEAEEESQHFISQARGKGDGTKPEWGYQDCMIRALSRYFRRSFFTRIRKPSCENCPSKLSTIHRGTDKPTPKEKAGRAAIVELYQCAEQHCQAYTRFPRYWDVRTLLLNPRGRAGESSNCFGMLCRALGSRVRWVWNAEDGIWTEVYSEHQKRWIHVDACEGAWDNPLLYTETMGKKMSYCIAFSSDGVTDVTRRYVRSPRHALPRTQCPEPELLRIIHDIKSKRRGGMSKEDLTRLEMEDAAEAQELEIYIDPSDVSGMAGHWLPAEVSLTKMRSGTTTPRKSSREGLPG